MLGSLGVKGLTFGSKTVTGDTSEGSGAVEVDADGIGSVRTVAGGLNPITRGGSGQRCHAGGVDSTRILENLGKHPQQLI